MTARLAPLLLALSLSLPASSALAGESSKLLDVTSKSEDAAKIVRHVLGKEEAAVDGCGVKFSEEHPGKRTKVALRVTLGPDGGAVGPEKGVDVERAEVACLGRTLAGISWPKANRKVPVTVVIELGGKPAADASDGPPDASEDVDLDRADEE